MTQKKTRLYGNVHYFSVDYTPTSVYDIKNSQVFRKTIIIRISNSQYFPPYTKSEIIKVELDLSNYATNLHVKTSDFALKTNLVSLKSEVDKLDIDKLIPVPNGLAKLSNKVANDLSANTDFNTL